MTTEANGARSTRDRVLEAICDAERFALITHENPDGDALGSLQAMQDVLTMLGKDSVMFMSLEELPLPYEYRFFSLHGLVTEEPEDVAERTIVFLDCGSLERNPADVFKAPGQRILNIDHHHDNTRFGTIDHVVPDASCTAEIVWDLMAGLGVAPTHAMAEALYVGLVTDTGRFMYENTGPRAHTMAAELIEAGVDVHDIYCRLYEGLPLAKLQLLQRALASLERHDGGALTVTRLDRADFEQTGAEESYTEGIIDHLRALSGTSVAAIVRERVTDSATVTRKVSLRAADGRVDVSRIARALGGGGHRQAAGFNTNLGWEELVGLLREAVSEQLGLPAPT